MAKTKPTPSTINLAALEESLLALGHSMVLEWTDGEDSEGGDVAGLSVACNHLSAHFAPLGAAVVCWEDGDLQYYAEPDAEPVELETYLPPGDPDQIAARMWAALGETRTVNVKPAKKPRGKR